MANSEIICAWCGGKFLKRNYDINRAARKNASLYCGKDCAGFGRRRNKTKEQLKEEKLLYDVEYREKNIVSITAKKAANFQKTYDPDKARIQRAKIKKNKPQIEAKRREYMASPEYTARKKAYDQEFRAKKKYGDYWECGILAIQINNEVKSRASDMEIRVQNGTLNKHLTRKRNYEKTICNQLERIPLGNLERNKI